MSEEPPPNPYSHPTSFGGLLLRGALAALALAGLIGVIWYLNR